MDELQQKWVNSLKDAFSRMDIAKLSALLDDEGSFFDLKKTDFLGKLELSFNELTKDGDSLLVPYAGHCKSAKCNLGCEGLSFYASQSKKKLVVRYEIGPSQTFDLDACGDFCTGIDAIDCADDMCIKVGKDERKDFIPDENYAQLKELCLEALQEIYGDPEQVISSASLVVWVEAYRDLYEKVSSFGIGYKAFEQFRQLFNGFRPLYAFLMNPGYYYRAFEAFDTKSEQFGDENMEVYSQWRETYKLDLPDNLWLEINPENQAMEKIPLAEGLEYVQLSYPDFALLHRLYFDMFQAAGKPEKAIGKVTE